ncbi:hypothetical protein G6L28_15340 [Agrobacterium larrymoorei]|uniref:hypothetical protein n=1 Tax=Agrobacterium larrymoorei TaxID=160699 RepID=UPI00157294A8|nr:hypothetical protein [Agrobacterium larrymoorei]NTJ43974.1 hypothetical protein [Agrobacterium larrymoorei]
MRSRPKKQYGAPQNKGDHGNLPEIRSTLHPRQAQRTDDLYAHGQEQEKADRLRHLETFWLFSARCAGHIDESPQSLKTISNIPHPVTFLIPDLIGGLVASSRQMSNSFRNRHRADIFMFTNGGQPVRAHPIGF